MQIVDLQLTKGGIPLQGNFHYVSSNYVEVIFFLLIAVFVVDLEGRESACLISLWDTQVATLSKLCVSREVLLREFGRRDPCFPLSL